MRELTHRVIEADVDRSSSRLENGKDEVSVPWDSRVYSCASRPNVLITCPENARPEESASLESASRAQKWTTGCASAASCDRILSVFLK